MSKANRKKLLYLALFVLAAILLLVAGCSPCTAPQAVTSKKELDTKVVTVLKALPTLPEIELRTEFKRKVDEVFKVTPGVDALDIMLYRICVMADEHEDKFTVVQIIEMQREAHKAWLTYVKGLEKVALERVKSTLPGEPLGPPGVTTSAVVPPGLYARVREAALRSIKVGAADEFRSRSSPPGQ